MKLFSLVLSFGLFFLPMHHCLAEKFDNLPKLIVKGEASIFKPSDQMEVGLGVVTVAEDSSEALKANKIHIQQIIQNLQTLGLDELDYQTGRFHIRPIYKKTSKKQEDRDPAIITSYEVVNTIQVKTQKIDLADKILNAAVRGGANQIDQVNFNLNNPQAYREEAIKLAAQNALADANSLAAATNVKIMRILYLSLDHWQNLPGAHMLSKKFENEDAVQEQNLFEPGNVEIHATVNVTFEIQPH